MAGWERSLEKLEMNPSSFWLDRPTFVTGGTGLLGSWLIQRLVEAGADIVCLVRDWIPQSELVRTEFIERIKVDFSPDCFSSLFLIFNF